MVAQLPTLELADLVPSDRLSPEITRRRSSLPLGAVLACRRLAIREPERVRSVLQERGWSRLVDKQLRFSQELQVLIAPEVLYRGIA